jgi:hypothetical protein
MNKPLCPKCNQTNPTFIRDWTDEGYSEKKMKWVG